MTMVRSHLCWVAVLLCVTAAAALEERAAGRSEQRQSTSAPPSELAAALARMEAMRREVDALKADKLRSDERMDDLSARADATAAAAAALTRRVAELEQLERGRHRRTQEVPQPQPLPGAPEYVRLLKRTARIAPHCAEIDGCGGHASGRRLQSGKCTAPELASRTEAINVRPQAIRS